MFIPTDNYGMYPVAMLMHVNPRITQEIINDLSACGITNMSQLQAELLRTSGRLHTLSATAAPHGHPISETEGKDVGDAFLISYAPQDWREKYYLSDGTRPNPVAQIPSVQPPVVITPPEPAPAPATVPANPAPAQQAPVQSANQGGVWNSFKRQVRITAAALNPLNRLEEPPTPANPPAPQTQVAPNNNP